MKFTALKTLPNLVKLSTISNWESGEKMVFYLFIIFIALQKNRSHLYTANSQIKIIDHLFTQIL